MADSSSYLPLMLVRSWILVDCCNSSSHSLPAKCLVSIHGFFALPFFSCDTRCISGQRLFFYFFLVRPYRLIKLMQTFLGERGLRGYFKRKKMPAKKKGAMRSLFSPCFRRSAAAYTQKGVLCYPESGIEERPLGVSLVP